MTPQRGDFLLPVQAYRTQYALQVMEVIDCTDSHAPGMTQLQFRRWGLDEQRRPFDDGHHGGGIETGRFRPVGKFAWRINDFPPEWGLGPIYFRQIPAPTKGGQLSLFL